MSMGGWVDEWMDAWMGDGWMYGWVNGQVCKDTHDLAAEQLQQWLEVGAS